MHLYINSFSCKFETNTAITFLFVQIDHGMGVLLLVLVFPSDTLFSMRLPDSVSIFTVEICANINVLEQIKDSVASKYMIFTLTFMSPVFTLYETRTSLNWDGDTKVCILNFNKNNIFY